MIVSRGETYELKRYPRVENSPYDYEETPDLIFYGRPASQFEKRNYRIQQGVDGNSDSVFVLSSNLPETIKPKDKIVFLGKEWQVLSIGYYFDQNLVLNGKVFSSEYIESRCPKGLNLQ